VCHGSGDIKYGDGMMFRAIALSIHGSLMNSGSMWVTRVKKEHQPFYERSTASVMVTNYVGESLMLYQLGGWDARTFLAAGRPCIFPIQRNWNDFTDYAPERSNDLSAITRPWKSIKTPEVPIY